MTASLQRISVPKGLGLQRGAVVALGLSLIKTAGTSFQSILNELCPDEVDFVDILWFAGREVPDSSHSVPSLQHSSCR